MSDQNVIDRMKEIAQTGKCDGKCFTMECPVHYCGAGGVDHSKRRMSVAKKWIKRNVTK